MCRTLSIHPKLAAAMQRLRDCADPADPWPLIALLDHARTLRDRAASLAPDIEPPIEVRVLGEAVGDAVARVRRNLPVTASLVGVGWVMGAVINAWLGGLFYTLRDTFFIFMT